MKISCAAFRSPSKMFPSVRSYVYSRSSGVMSFIASIAPATFAA